VPEALTHPQLRRYRLRRLRLPVGKGFLDLVVPDGRQWLRQGDWVPDTERGAEPPYWVEIWPASIAAARLLARLGPLAGKQVLDLGCGLGVPGIAAASVGATVTFADRQPDALAFACWNAQRAHAEHAQPVASLCDWSSGLVEGRFDYLVLADVSYRPVHHGPLLRHIGSCLAAGGVVVHADPFRRESDGFLVELRRRLITREVTQQVAYGGRRVAVRLVCAAADETSLPACFGDANVAGSLDARRPPTGLPPR
jgi:predicted nicotinamide N-methyase